MAQMKAFKILMQLCQSPLQTSIGWVLHSLFVEPEIKVFQGQHLYQNIYFPPFQAMSQTFFSLNRQACEINSQAIFLCVSVIWPMVLSLKIDILTSLEVFYCSNLIFFGGRGYHKNLSRRRESAACPARWSLYHL